MRKKDIAMVTVKPEDNNNFKIEVILLSGRVGREICNTG